MMQKVFLGLVGGLVVYELWALADRIEGNTISEIVWTTTTKRPILPFTLGVLMGHFFWQRVASDQPAQAPLPL